MRLGLTERQKRKIAQLKERQHGLERRIAEVEMRLEQKTRGDRVLLSELRDEHMAVVRERGMAITGEDENGGADADV